VVTEDGFAPDDPLPLFLSGHADEDEPRVSILRLNASILILTTTCIGAAMALSAGTPAKIFADIKASLTAASAPQPGTDRSMTAIQSAADARALQPSATGAPTRDVPATIASSDQKQAKISAATAGALLKQFEAWAATQDEQAQIEPVQPVDDAWAQVEPGRPVEDVRAPVSQDTQAPVRPVQKHRRIRSVQNARAELRPLPNPRARLRRDRTAPVGVQPVQDVRAQDQPVQNAQPPSLLQSLGWRQ